MIPPTILVVAGGRRKKRLWIPLFLAWIILFPFVLLLLPLMIAVCVFAAVKLRSAKVLMFLPRLYMLICSLRGLKIDVDDKSDRVYISIS